MKKQQKNHTNKLLENLRKEKNSSFLQAIFGGADLADMQLTSKVNK